MKRLFKNKKKTVKKDVQLYITMPTANGEKVDEHTNVKIPSDHDVEELKNFSQEHRL